jgi:hypothetical protein
MSTDTLQSLSLICLAFGQLISLGRMRRSERVSQRAISRASGRCVAALNEVFTKGPAA